MYKLVDRYISTKFITNVVMIIIVFIILFLLVDIVEHLNYIIDSAIPRFELLRYFLYSVPWYTSLGQPMALLLGTVFTLGILHKNNDANNCLIFGILGDGKRPKTDRKYGE